MRTPIFSYRVYFMLIAVSVISAQSYSAEGITDASARIVTPITIVNTQDLAFGKISPQTGGNVVINTSGVGSKTGSIVLITAESTHNQAQFEITGGSNSTFTITLPHSAIQVIDGAAHSMSIGKFVSDPGGSGVICSSGANTLNVGGTLKVAADQSSGNYAGNFIVTVEYN